MILINNNKWKKISEIVPIKKLWENFIKKI